MYVRSMYRISKKVCVVFLSVMTLALLLSPSGASGQTATPSISFLSPSSFNGEVPTVTDADGGVDTAFRLSAWTANAPAGALVEFELVPGDNLSPAITIGTGQSVAADTYEYLWDVAEGPTGILEGGHTLKAILYDAAGVELASDALTVNLLHGTGTSTGDGEPAIDLTYPVSGGVLGQYHAPGGATNSVLDGIHKDERASVTPYFTTSAPGTPPHWIACGDGEGTTRYPDGVRCTYPSDDPSTDIDEGIDTSQVTAVALLLLTKNTSADVARAFPYLQVPSGLSFEMLAPKKTSGGPSTDPGSRSVQKDPTTGAFPCSDWVRTLLTDQVGRKIAGANIDAHATGPSDQLKFHTGYLSIDPPRSQAPSDGHGFPEPGTNCVLDADTIAKQGEHGVAAAPDRKHIESVSGTRDSGFFDIRLRTDQPGVTQLTVWADKTEDDKYCSDESDAALSTSLGWGTGEPATEPEAPSDCGTVLDPDPTVSPDPDPDPDFDGSRSVRIETSSSSVPAGRKVKVIGAIDAADEMCSVSQTLKLRAKRPSASRFRTIATRTTDIYGLHSFSVRVKRTKVYRIVAPVAGECVRAVSEIRKIRAL